MATYNPKSPLKKPSSPTSEAPFFNTTTKGSTPFFPIQPKLTIGKPGDKFEQEADQMANTVVNGGASEQTVQRMGGPEEEEMAQGKIQLMEEEEEAIQPKIQKMAEPDEEAEQMV